MNRDLVVLFDDSPDIMGILTGTTCNIREGDGMIELSKADRAIQCHTLDLLSRSENGDWSAEVFKKHGYEIGIHLHRSSMEDDLVLETVSEMLAVSSGGVGSAEYLFAPFVRRVGDFVWLEDQLNLRSTLDQLITALVAGEPSGELLPAPPGADLPPHWYSPGFGVPEPLYEPVSQFLSANSLGCSLGTFRSFLQRYQTWLISVGEFLEEEGYALLDFRA